MMERAIWKSVTCIVSLLFLELCNGLPIGLGHTYEDGHTQLLTGLVAILLTICGVVCLAGCLCCQRRNGFKDKVDEEHKQEFHDSVVIESVGNNLDHGHVNPLAGRNEFTIFNPLTKDAVPQSNVFTQGEEQVHQVVLHKDDAWKCENIDVRSWFDNGESEFPRARLKYIRELGKGWFGRVVEGTARGLDPADKDAWKPVVVRILEASASSRQRLLFLHDASIYRCSPHPNILLLLGRSLNNVPLLLLQEYSSQGDVKSLLRKQANNEETFLKGALPLRWCYQLTCALKHLHSSKLIHFDLATRNCRLTDGMDLKLGDYGCSTSDYPEDYYHGTESIPIRWCAPESVAYTSTTIQTKNVTQTSNIWSLGVCLWEIYECGAQPYRNLSDDEVVSQVLGSPCLRLKKPRINILFTDYLYRLMQMCWLNSEIRPTIHHIHPMLEDLVEIYKHTMDTGLESMPDFDQRWANMKPNNKLEDSLNSNSLDTPTQWVPDSENCKRDKVPFKLDHIDHALRTSSESETEDENWRRNVECGLYTEKVRQKSRSVADLMVLTHIDHSESDSETPLPSLNYKNVRYAAPKQNLENVSLTFGSEGNLISVQTTFEEELRKLQEQRRDSLLFVPASTHNSPAKMLLQDLNGTATIEPANQIYNVYNVVTMSPNISPLHVSDLNKIINYNDDSQNLPDVIVNAIETTRREIPKLSEIIENNIELMDYIISKYDPENECLPVEVESNDDNSNLVTTSVPHGNEVPDIIDAEITCRDHSSLANVQLIKGESSESDEYVTANTHTVTDSITEDITDTTSESENKLKARRQFDVIEEETIPSREEGNESLDDETEDFFTPISQQNSDSFDEITDSERTYCCESTVKSQIAHDDKLTNQLYVPNDLVDDGVQMLAETRGKIHIETLQTVLQENSAISRYVQKSLAKGDNATIQKTQDFLNTEILTYEDCNHSSFHAESHNAADLESAFTSTPTNTYNEVKKSDLKFSLETWDNFLGQSFEDQRECEDYLGEPMSLLFTEDDPEECDLGEANKSQLLNGTYVKDTDWQGDVNKTLVPENESILSIANATYVKDVDLNDIEITMEKDCYENPGFWEGEHSTGWYLHPQGNNDDLHGDMEVSQENDSYVRFSMDDELMAAVRNELSMKLPQAQKAASGQMEDGDGEYETSDRNEVFLRYSCFNTPLSPIPEESYSEYLNSGQSTPHCTINTDLGGSESDWSETGLGQNSLEEDTHSPRLMESPHKGTQNRNTPSQDSCCSNDTLFNLEELQYNEKQLQEIEERKRRVDEQEQFISVIVHDAVERALQLCESSLPRTSNDNDYVTMSHTLATPSESDNIDSLPSSNDVTVIKVDAQESPSVHSAADHTHPSQEIFQEEASSITVEAFVANERNASIQIAHEAKDSGTSSLPFNTITSICYASHNVAPLNSPEDRPWKHIEASLSNCPKIPEDDEQIVIYDLVNDDKVDNALNINTDDDYEAEMNMRNSLNSSFSNDNIYDIIDDRISNIHDGPHYVNENYEQPSYVNSDIQSYETAGTANEMNADFVNQRRNFDEEEDDEYDQENDPLADIRFTGPGDAQMMATSFSEDHDLCDERDWDSGSDTRSSSSCEFIWKEGESIANVKALQAAPQDIATSSEAKYDDESTSCSDEDGDGMEFVPSAWDKFATPTKSALRSPEKSLDRLCIKKGRGVSFKKQKYHCVYEYPREPETPVIQSFDLWKDPNYIAWDLDRSSDTYLPSTSDYPETASPSDLNLIKDHQINYDFTGSSTLDDDFYISSSSKPFDMLGEATSQFFPGKHCDWSDLIKNNDNVTPDSGVEDITPGSLSDSSDYVRPIRQILPLKTLAQLAANRNVNVESNEIGRLRHTKNRLKLDLPTTSFTIDSPDRQARSKFKFDLPSNSFRPDSPEQGDITESRIPTFTTFGKSRFFVQQVDTSTYSEESKRNVSFEALPYRPMSKQFIIKNDLNRHAEKEKSRIEIVRGEASLLDSADEDSGIESCTLERKNVSEVSE